MAAYMKSMRIVECTIFIVNIDQIGILLMLISEDMIYRLERNNCLFPRIDSIEHRSVGLATTGIHQKTRYSAVASIPGLMFIIQLQYSYIVFHLECV